MTLKNSKETNAVFSIKNSQMFEDKQELLELVTEGYFYLKNDTYFIMYKEYTELGNISVLIKITGDTVVMRRSGACNARMEYQNGYKQEVLYRVPFGDIVIDLETQNVSNKLNFNGGSLELKYSLVINHEKYYNDMKLEVEVNNI